MNELVKVDFETQMVSARDLYELLNVSKRFSAWFEINSQKRVGETAQGL